MNIVLYGATGKSGHPILTELLSRGHHVTAIVRTPSKLAAQPNLTIKQGTVDSAAEIAAAIKGADAVVSAYGPVLTEDGVRELIPVTQHFIDAMKQVAASGDPAKRFLYVEYDDGEREFYDLRTDPFELHNIADTLAPFDRALLDIELANLKRCHGGPACWAAMQVSSGIEPLRGSAPLQSRDAHSARRHPRRR